MTTDVKLGLAIHTLFRSWSASRIGRWLDVNPRTVARWFRDTGPGQPPPSVPDDVRERIAQQLALVTQTDDYGDMFEIVEDMLERGIHHEIVAAQLADIFMKVTGREIE
jgi:hypothetical protein